MPYRSVLVKNTAVSGKEIPNLMAHYLVTADLSEERAEELYKGLKFGEYRDLKPFGNELTDSLLEARYNPDTGRAVWEEEDYCSPPLAQEREALLDRYFNELEVEEVSKGEGWERIGELPSLWDRMLDRE